MAMTFEEFDQAAAPASSSAMTFDEFESSEPKFDQRGGLGANLAFGALRGASNIGSTMLRPIDAALNATGLTDMTNEERKAALNEFFAENADTDSAAYKVGEIGAEIAGTGGAGGLLARGVLRATPHLPKLVRALETGGLSVGSRGASFGERGVNAATRVGAGAAAGAAGAAMVNPEDAMTGATIGAAIPAVGALAGQGARGIGWLRDAISGRLGHIRAARIAREAAGTQLPLIQAVNANARPGLTSGQAAAGVDQDTWQALGKFAERNDQHSYYRMLEDAQEAARQAHLQSVTPDLQAAEAARASADAVNYPTANAARFNADPDLILMADNPYFRRAQAATEDLRQAGGITFNSNPTETLNTIKFGLDRMLAATGDSALAGSERRAVQNLKEELVAWVDRRNPAYRVARTEHERLSEPIEQANVMGELQDTLSRVGGGERVNAFLDAGGRGENALLRRAGQSPRFGDLEDILTSRQLAARGHVAGELIRDRTIRERATAGEGGLRRILEQQRGVLKFPSFINAGAAAANRGLDALERTISQGTLRAIVEGMQSGVSANQLLATVPTSERNAALMWVIQGGPQRLLSPSAVASQGAE